MAQSPIPIELWPIYGINTIIYSYFTMYKHEILFIKLIKINNFSKKLDFYLNINSKGLISYIATIVIRFISRNSNVTFFSPIRTPWISHKPEFLTILDSIANKDTSMTVAITFSIKNSRFLKLKQAYVKSDHKRASFKKIVNLVSGAWIIYKYIFVTAKLVR